MVLPGAEILQKGTRLVMDRAGKIPMVYRIVILAGTVLLCSALFLFLVYMPKSAAFAEKREEIEGIERTITQARGKAAHLKKFEAEEKEAKAQFQEALHLLPNEKEIPNLLRMITKLGNDAKLQFTQFSPLEERQRDFYAEIPVSLEVKGKFPQILYFFKKISEMDRIVNVLDLSIRPDKEMSTQLIARCTAITYRFKGDSGEKPAAKKG